MEAAAAEAEAVRNAEGAAALEVWAVSCRHGRAAREPLLSACDMLLSDMPLTWRTHGTRRCVHGMCARMVHGACAWGMCMGHGW